MNNEKAFEVWWDKIPAKWQKEYDKEEFIWIWENACEYQKIKDAEVCMEQHLITDTQYADAIIDQKDE